jgi:hypothetical protein
MADNWIAARVKSATRSAGLTGLALLFFIAAIGAALAGSSILLARLLGAANAAFVMSGALALAAAVLLVIVRLMRPKPTPIAAQPAVRALALAAALRLADRLSGRQMLFLFAGTMIGLSTFLLGATDDRRK